MQPLTYFLVSMKVPLERWTMMLLYNGSWPQIYWERLFTWITFLNTHQKVWFCPKLYKLVFCLDICCCLFDCLIWVVASVAWIKSLGSDSQLHLEKWFTAAFRKGLHLRRLGYFLEMSCTNTLFSSVCIC